MIGRWSRGYVRNMAASSLMTQATHTIAFLVHEPDLTFFKDPNIAAMMLGAVREFRPAGIQLVMLASESDVDIRLASEYILGGHVDGAMLVSGRSDDPLLAALSHSTLPHIMAGRPAGPYRSAFVDTDNYEASREITHRLIKTGRKRLLHIAGPQYMESARSRLGGFLSATAEAEVTGLVHPAGSFSFDGGAEAIRKSFKPGIDGIVASSDAAAAGALSELLKLDVRLPDEIGIVGFDDNDWAIRSVPRLSTVRQSPELIGGTMARYLLAKLAGEEPDDVNILPFEIVWRESA